MNQNGVELILPDEIEKDLGGVLYVQQYSTWGVTARWELSHGSPQGIGWFQVEQIAGDRFEPPTVDVSAVALAEMLGVDGMSRVQRQRILNYTEDFIEKVLAAYMAGDDRIFNKAMGWVGAVTESDWDDVARQTEALRREWREEVKKDG